VRDAELGQLPVEPRDLIIPLPEGRTRPLNCGTLLLELALRLFPPQTLALEGGPGLGKSDPLLLELGLRLLARDFSCRSCSSVVASVAALSAKLVLSPSASLALSCAWLCQARAPSRVVQSCWSWARTEATSASHSAARVRAPARSSRALCSASSRSTSAVFSLSIAETSSAT
jgi:hypothetical protein